MANAAFDFNGSGNEAQSPSAKAVAEKLTFLQANISKCAVCDKRVYDNEKFALDQRIYHKTCFRCTTCRSTLTVKTFRLGGGMLYCHRHYLESFHKFNNYDFKESPRRPSVESHVTSPMAALTVSSSDKSVVRDHTIIERPTSRESYERPTVQVPKSGERPPMVELMTSPSISGPNTGAGVNNIRAMFETGVKSTPSTPAVSQEKNKDAAVLSMMMNQSTAKARMAKFSGNSIDEAPAADNEESHSRSVHTTTSTHSSTVKHEVSSFDNNENDDKHTDSNNHHHFHVQHQQQQQQQHYEEEEEGEDEDEQEVQPRHLAGEKNVRYQEDSDHDDREENRSVGDDDETEEQYHQHYSDQRDRQQHVGYNDDDEPDEEGGYRAEENGEYHDEEDY